MSVYYLILHVTLKTKETKSSWFNIVSFFFPMEGKIATQNFEISGHLVSCDNYFEHSYLSVRIF